MLSTVETRSDNLLCVVADLCKIFCPFLVIIYNAHDIDYAFVVAIRLRAITRIHTYYSRSKTMNRRTQIQLWILLVKGGGSSLKIL